MIINHNIPALVTNNSLNKANASTDKASKRLSTGRRINSAADDAAGLAISNKMKTQVKGLKMADRNCNDAISLIQTAEGGLAEVQNMLQRMRELALQGANDTLTTSDRQKIQDECDQLIDEITDTSNKIQFNTKSLLNGKYDTFTFQVGPNSGLTLTVQMEEITPYKIGAYTDEKGTYTSLSQLRSQPTKAVKIGIETNVPNYTDPTTGNVEKRITFAQYLPGNPSDPTDPGAVKATTYTKGTSTMPTETKITKTGLYLCDGTNLYDSDGNIVTDNFKNLVDPLDPTTDIGFDITESPYKDATATNPILINVTSSTNEEGATIYKESVTQLTPSTVDGEIIAKNPQLYILSVDDSQQYQMALNEEKNKLIIKDTEGVGGFVTVESCAYTALLVCDGAINDVSELRSRLGAVQNRLEYTSSSLGTASENAETSLSRVEDTDMAAEMTEYTKNNVIVQAGISMLAQANQRPNQLLSLLQ